MSNKIIDLIKTALIYMLTLSMLAFSGIYINARQNAGQGRTEVPFEIQRIFEIGGAFFADMNEAHFNPVQITVTLDGESVTAIHNDDLISRVYDDFIRFVILALFNRSAKCEMLDRAAGESLWQKAAASENSIYIRYAGDYIYPVLYAFLSGNFDSVDTSGDIAKVRELFIIDADPVFGVSRDSEGNIAAFIPSEESRIRGDISARINASLQVAYTNIVGGTPARFLNSNIISGETGANSNNMQNFSFCPSFHLFDNRAIYLPALSFENPLLDNDGNIDLQKSYIRSLFRLLNFNHESAYSIPGTNFYTDGAKSIRFTAGGQIIYTHRAAGNRNTGGLHLARFLGYDADYFTFFEQLKAASAFANSVSQELAGGEASLFLKDIFFENDALSIVFAYYHRGTEVRIKGADGAIILRVNQNGISDVTINAARFISGGMTRSINPVLILNEADRLISEDAVYVEELAELSEKYNLRYDKNQGKFLVNRVELVYNIDCSSGQREFAPVWIIR